MQMHKMNYCIRISPITIPPPPANGPGQDSSFLKGGPLPGGGHDSSFQVGGPLAYRRGGNWLRVLSKCFKKTGV